MADSKVKKVWVKKPPRKKNPKPVQNRCGICEQPCTPEKKVHDGCIRRQQKRAKRSAVKMKEVKAKKVEIVAEDAQVRAEEAKQAKAKAEAAEASVVGQEGN